MIFAMTIPSDDSGRELERCLAAMAHGDTGALARLYRSTAASVYGFALSILKRQSDAEDVMQEAYLKIWQAAGSYQPRQKPMAWILTIVRRLALDRLRDQSRLQPLDAEQYDRLGADLPAVSQEDRLTLETLLEKLEDTDRQIVILHALTGLKHREIAALLDLPLPTVLSKYRRALKKLQLAWKEAD